MCVCASRTIFLLHTSAEGDREEHINISSSRDGEGVLVVMNVRSGLQITDAAFVEPVFQCFLFLLKPFDSFEAQLLETQ